MRALALATLPLASLASDLNSGTAYLVESIPMQQDDVQLIDGARYTWEVLTSYANSAQKSIHFTSMYENLLAQNKNQKPGDRNFTADEFRGFGSDKGKDFLEALEKAAQRGVQIRALVNDHQPSEFTKLADKYADAVEVRAWNSSEWYDGGIMHMKTWIFDDERAYVGSSNTDWLSLTQIFEMGVAFEGSPGFGPVADVQKLFDRFWLLGGPDRPMNAKVDSFDALLQQTRQVPCWEKMAVTRDEAKCKSPFPSHTNSEFNSHSPMALTLNGTESRTFLTCSPPSVCDSAQPVNPMYAIAPDGREWDGSALIHTILSAEKSVCLSVMDYVPATVYRNPVAAWPALNDALIAKLRQGAHVRVMVSHWAHSLSEMFGYVSALNATAASCNGTPDRPCMGKFEIRAFEVPGWDQTQGGDAQFPPISRVNHDKFIVTDKRFNIGTSNMVWGYYHNTAGTSFNSDHEGLRTQLQAAFDRNWNSPFAKPLDGSPLLRSKASIMV